ncbi:MAG TPA: methyltransferase [Chitinophagaceae bacterium]|nr:methyltransferase [Chitinophagaceae bacterium]
MANPYFRFKQFTVRQEHCAMKVTTDACLFGAWISSKLQNQFPDTVLDIGAGTGLLSLMLAQKCTAYIDAIEIDTGTAAQAIENVNSSPWAGRISVIQGDAREYTFSRKYQSIISNPPFYENELAAAEMKKNIAQHSTALTLVGLLQIIRNNLAPGGSFFLLYPYKRAVQVQQALRQQSLYLYEKVLVRQSVRHDFFRVMIQGGCREQTTTEHEIAIWDEEQQYTTVFTDLLKDYYLYL